MWSLDEQVSSVSADSASGELATGGVDGIVTIWDSDGWKAKCTLSINPNRDPVEFVRYGRAKSSNLPASFLMVCVCVCVWGGGGGGGGGGGCSTLCTRPVNCSTSTWHTMQHANKLIISVSN